MLTFARAGKVLFGSAVAAVLAFGATEARAAPQSAACPAFNLATGNVGACSSSTACSNTCLFYYPENGGVGMCRNGCCLCAT
jgi:hypothetical protein